MKKLIALLVLCVSFATANAQEKKAAIEFESDMIDYGEVPRRSDGVRQFKFTNTGDAMLVISSVSSTCGCTIPKKPEGPIAPGEMGVIEVKYDTNRAEGPFRKTITVRTNASEEPIALKIKGTLVAEKSAMVKEKVGPTNG
ncbi:MAG: DUF1573 domain-containing protein [Leeuwenhoekiella sp.]